MGANIWSPNQVYIVPSTAFINVKDAPFLAQGNGVTDDRQSILDALYYIVANGGILFFPPGVYPVSAAISLSGYPGVTKKAFTILGAGPEATFIDRLDGCGTPLNLRSLPQGAQVRQLSVRIYANTRPTNANLGIVVGEASDVLVEDIICHDPRAGAVSIFSEASSGGGVIKNCLINRVISYGDYSAGNIGTDVGILIAGQQVTQSGVTNCQVYAGGRDAGLSPGIGIELKFSGPGCYISDCYAEDFIQGFGFAGSALDGYCEKVRLNNLHAKNCSTTFNAGWLENSVGNNIILDMANQAGVNEPFQLSRSGNTFTNVQILNLGNVLKYPVRLIGDASNNVIHISYMNNANSADLIFSAEANSNNNTIIIDRMPAPVLTSLVGKTNDLTSGLTNKVIFEGVSAPVIRTIATGAIAVNRRDTVVIVDTEGGAATDDLDNITGGFDGQIISLRSQNNGRDPTIRDTGGGTGNIRLVGGGAGNFTFATARDGMDLMYKENLAVWTELTRVTI